MVPATRTIVNSSANDEPVTRQSVEDALAQIRQMIVGLGAQNNQGARQANQFSRLAKVEFSKFNGDDVLGWMFKCDQFFLIDNTLEEEKLSRVEVSEEYAISLYLGGLPTELEMSVRMFRPKTLSDAYCLTTLQEATLEAVKKKSRPFTNQSNNRFGVSNASGTTNKLALLPKPNTPTPGSVRKQLTQKKYEEKRSKNLCFYCDQKYVPGHKCKTVNEGVQAHISLNALSGISSFQTMRVIGLVAKQHQLHILVDSGSTHNFLDVNMAKIMGCKVWSTCPLAVSVPGGKHMVTVRGCDMVLGVQWLSTLGDIKLNFQELKIEFVHDMPTKLLPPRSQDHRIPLMPGTQPVNIRPYRHPPVQKDAIKAMVKELLDAGVIKHNQSSFASLCGYGYHQIRMYEEDIVKTAFETHEGHYEFLVMPFGLTNAPSTFQALMNDVFREYLRKFTLVFFDDILIYSKSLEDHIQHLSMVLSTMRKHGLFAKESKCVFGTTHVEYLGHVISAEGVATDPERIQAMQCWSTPTNIKQLRGFLGLTGYYRRFIKDFTSISRPLTQLLKKNSFQWSNEAQQAFTYLKNAMVQAHVLALPNFNKPFVVETDASGVGLGSILQQEGHPIAYMSKTLAPRHQALSTYEKEFLAVLMALDK
ncbi:transposon ty3-I gag-pol polyprotein, partial [Tanacetum coccineum]